MAVRLFVGNLPYDTTETALRELFSAVGPLIYVHLPTDRETGRKRGFAFVELADQAQADAAVRRFNNQLLNGRPLVVNEARPKENRPAAVGIDQPYPRSREEGRFEGARGMGALPRDRDSQPVGAPAAGPAGPEGGKRPGRSFGPDAPTRGRGKAKSRPRAETAQKKPIQVRGGGRFFDADDDGAEDDLIGENFASRVEQPESQEEPGDDGQW